MPWELPTAIHVSFYYVSLNIYLRRIKLKKEGYKVKNIKAEETTLSQYLLALNIISWQILPEDQSRPRICIICLIFIINNLYLIVGLQFVRWYVEIFAFSRLGISVSRRSFGDLSNYKIEGEKAKNVGPTNQPILPPTQRFIYQVL